MVFDESEEKFYDEIGSRRTGFADLWAHLHGAASWDANPEVVVIGFNILQTEET